MAGKIRHLLYRQGRYYTRVVVPVELRPIIGKRELFEALGADRAQALRKHVLAVAEMQGVLDAARKGVEKPRQARRLTTDEAARAHYDAELVIDELARDAPARDDSGDFDCMSDPADFRARFLPGYQNALTRVASGRATDDEIRAAIGWAIDDFAERGKVTLIEGSTEWRRFARTLAGVHIETLKRVQERDQGDFAGTPSHPTLTLKAAPASKDDPLASRILGADSTKTLAEVAQRFLAERNAKPSTNFEYEVAVRILDEHLGEPKPIYSITRADIHELKRALAEAPASYTKRFPGKSFPEAIKANKARRAPFPTLAAHTINNKYLSKLNAIFTWAVGNDIIPDSPVAGIKIDKVKATEKPRVNFSPDDLTRIFRPPFFDRTKTLGEMQWAMILSLYTGARPSELAQVKLDSIHHERGVLVIAIEEETKNVGSQRMIPVHTDLLKLGFADHVTALRQRGATHLFPDWYAKGMAAKAGAQAKFGIEENRLTLNHYFPRFLPKQFNGTILRRVGIADRRKTWYSFRHTFKTGLALAGVDKPTRDYLCGHKDYSAGATYVHEISIETMKAAIKKLMFDGLPALT